MLSLTIKNRGFKNMKKIGQTINISNVEERFNDREFGELFKEVLNCCK